MATLNVVDIDQICDIRTFHFDDGSVTDATQNMTKNGVMYLVKGSTMSKDQQMAIERTTLQLVISSL